MDSLKEIFYEALWGSTDFRLNKVEVKLRAYHELSKDDQKKYAPIAEKLRKEARDLHEERIKLNIQRQTGKGNFASFVREDQEHRLGMSLFGPFRWTEMRKEKAEKEQEDPLYFEKISLDLRELAQKYPVKISRGPLTAQELTPFFDPKKLDHPEFSYKGFGPGESPPGGYRTDPYSLLTVVLKNNAKPRQGSERLLPDKSQGQSLEQSLSLSWGPVMLEKLGEDWAEPLYETMSEQELLQLIPLK